MEVSHTSDAIISEACSFSCLYKMYEAPKNAQAAPVAIWNSFARRMASGLGPVRSELFWLVLEPEVVA